MNNAPRSSRTLFLLLLLPLGLFDVWAGWNWHASREDAFAARGHWAASENLALKIEALRTSPVQVEEQVQSRADLARLVETAANEVGLERTRIVRIDPGDPRRLAESDYLEQGTDIELREVPLKQVVEFTIVLGNSGPGLGVSTLSLRVPPGADATPQNQELWNVQLLLTSRSYDPKIPPAADSSAAPLR